jgi:5'(3')-deoxyribonucleotidase
MKRILYLDMDGVLADFEGTTQALLGSEYNWKEEVDKPHWGMVQEIQNLYAILKPLPDAHELWDWVHTRFDDVRILTAIPKRAHFPEAVNDKRNWIHKHFGPAKVCFGPYAYDKQFHCTDGDILIDDAEINIKQWNSRGGYGILHTSTKNTIEIMGS